MRNKAESQEVWGERIAAWRASGQTQSVFCEAQGFNRNTMAKWINQLNLGNPSRKKRKQSEKPKVKSEDSQEWITLETRKRIDSEPLPNIKIHCHHFTIELPEGVSPTNITTILEVMKTVC